MNKLILAASVLASAACLLIGVLLGSGAKFGRCECLCCNCVGLYWPGECDCDPNFRPKQPVKPIPGWIEPLFKEQSKTQSPDWQPMYTNDPVTGERKQIGWNSWGPTSSWKGE